MDVRYNNIFESTRQFFQGVPVKNGSKKNGSESLPPQPAQRIDTNNHAEYLAVVPSSNSGTYWPPQHEVPKKTGALQRHPPFNQFHGERGVASEPYQPPSLSNHLPSIATLSPAPAANFQPYKASNKMPHWGQFHSKPATVASNPHTAPSNVPVSIPHYSLSSQVSVTSSSNAFYYPASVQAASSKNAYSYHPHPLNDFSMSPSHALSHMPNPKEPSPYSVKANSYLVNSKQESAKTNFSPSSNHVQPSISGFKPPIPSPKFIPPYLSTNESSHLISKTIPSDPNSHVPRASLSFANYGNNPGIHIVNPPTSQSSYRTDSSDRTIVSQNLPAKFSVSAASASTAFSYSVPKIQPTGFQHPSNQVNLKSAVDRGESSTYINHKNVRPSAPRTLHESGGKASRFPSAPVQPIRSEMKLSTHFPTNHVSVLPPRSESSRTPQQFQHSNNQNHDLWVHKMKRESPLDLSVKTVRQSADSTAIDEQESHNLSLPGFQTLDFRFKPKIPESFNPLAIRGASFPPISHLGSASTASAPTSADFMKPNFNPNFTMQHHSQSADIDHEKTFWKANINDGRAQQQNSNSQLSADYLLNSQRSQQSELLIKGTGEQHYYEDQLYSLPHRNDGNNQSSRISQNFSSSKQHSTQITNLSGNSAQHQPVASNFAYSNPMFVNSNEIHMGKKRLLPVDSMYESKTKSPKSDSWKQTIDQQIEEKFRSHVTLKANEKLHSETPPNFPISSVDCSSLSKSDQNALKSNSDIKPLPLCEGRLLLNTKVLSPSPTNFRPRMNFTNNKEVYSQVMRSDVPPNSSIATNRSTQQSLVKSYEPLSEFSSFKMKSNILKKEDRNSSLVNNEALGNNCRMDPVPVNANSVIQVIEDQDKAAPRPRTKAELKQVASNAEFVTPDALISNDYQSKSSFKVATSCSNTSISSEDVESGESKSEDGAPTPQSVTSVSPPKLTKEQLDSLPRKKLFSDQEESDDGQNASDACIFDFHESDSECEMPVLERQTLHEMRRERDRRVNSKIAFSKENLATDQGEIEQPLTPVSEPKDPFWSETCDSFLEQLTASPLKKKKKNLKKQSTEVLQSINNSSNNKYLDNNRNSLKRNVESINNEIKEKIISEDSLGLPKVIVRDIKKEDETCFANLKLDKLSTNELKREIASLTNIKKELEEKIMESSSTSEKKEPLDELRSNCLVVKKLKAKSSNLKSEDVENEENIKVSVNLKLRKRRRMKRLGSADGEQVIPAKIREKGSSSTPTRLSDSSDSKSDVSISDHSRRRGRPMEINVKPTGRKLVSRDSGSNSKPTKKLLLRKVKRKDSSESVLSTESEENTKSSRSVPSKLDSESSINKRSLINPNNKRKLLRRRRGSSSVGGRPGLRSAASLRSTKSMLNVKRQKQMKNKKRKLSPRAVKQVEGGKMESQTKDKEPVESITESVHLTKKKFKFKSVRRKFRSSGFDYLRKKKKQMKKSADCDEVKVKKLPAIRTKPESVDDLQAEIKGWVINKGLGESTLHRAARLGYPDAVAYCLEVLEVGAGVRDNAGYTPLHEASHRGHLAIARMLLLYGADSSASAIGGIRPLHEAAENGHLELVRLLLSYGADPLLATYSGQTPISLAHDTAMKNLLEHHLADVQGLIAPKWDFTNLSSLSDCIGESEAQHVFRTLGSGGKMRGALDVLLKSNYYHPNDISADDSMSGCDVLFNPPDATLCNDLDVEIEYSENYLPCTFWLIGEPMSDLWALWQEVASVLRLKSTDALLKLLGQTNSEILRELNPSEFASKASNPSIFGASNFKCLNKSQKIILVKYTEQLRSCMKIDKIIVSSR